MEVRFLDCRTVSHAQLAQWEQWLAPEKQQRLARLPEKKRLQSLCGDGLAREMLSRLLGTAPQEVTFTYTDTGKPLVEGAYFNVSHSGDMVGCAVSAGPVGLDIERIRPVSQRLRRALPQSTDSDEAFFRLWTKREALLKCCGESVARWRAEELSEDGYQFSYPFTAEDYVAAICEKRED